MKASLLYRTAAGVLALGALGHTVGFLRFKAPTPQAHAVRQAMDQVVFTIGGAPRSFGGFYVGFGLDVTAYMLFTAFLAWHLGGLANREPRAIGALGWAFCALQLANVALTLEYFSATPAIFAGLVAIATGWATWLVQNPRRVALSTASRQAVA
jgi:hypothetical protein